MISVKLLPALVLAVSVGLTGCSSKVERAAEYAASGDRHFSEGDLESARIEYSNALQLDQNNLAALDGMSKLQEQNQQLPDLFRTLNRIVELSPNDIDARLRLIKLLAYVNQVADALEQSEIALGLAPDRLDLKVVQVGLLFRANRPEEAVNLAEQVLKAEPANREIAAMLASYRLRQGDHQAALAALGPALQQAPNDRILNLLRINVLNAQGDSDSAIAVFERLVADNSDDVDLHKAFAGQYLKAGDKQAAERLLLELAGRVKTVKANLAPVEYLLAQNDAHGAENRLKEYIRAYPDQTQLQFILAELYLSSDRIDQAKALLSGLMNSQVSEAARLDAKNALATIAGLEGDTARQIQLFKEVVAADPSNVAAIVGLARHDLENDQVEKAVGDLRLALRSAPNSAQVHLALGQAHEQQKAVELAQDHYANAVRYGGVNPLYVAEFGRFLISKGDFAFAEDILEKALQQEQGSARILSLLAQVKLSTSQWSEAQHYAEKLEQLGADQSLISRIRGLAHSGKQEYDQSIEHFRSVQEAAPGNFRPLATLVGAYLKAGKADEAQAYLDSTLDNDPTSFHAQILKGAVYEYQKDFSAAETTYKRALDANPDRKELYRRLVQILSTQEQFDEALNVVRKGRQQLGADDLSLAMSEALLLQRMGRRDESVAVYRQILQQHPNADAAYNNLALILLEGDEASKQEARALAERFRNSQVPHFQDSLGWVYLQTGNKIEALYLLEKAAEGLKGVAEVHYHLGMAYLANDRKFEAKRELEYAVEKSGQSFPGLDAAKATLEDLRQG